MDARFVAAIDGNGAWKVIDNEYKTWHMSEQAVSMFLRREAAHKIADILNREWSAFLANPT